MLLSNSQMYSKLFRPWDGVEEKIGIERKLIEKKLQVEISKEKLLNHRKNVNEKGNKLRKIRSTCKLGVNQDCTISTTTSDECSLVNSICSEYSPEKFIESYKEREKINEKLGHFKEKIKVDLDTSYDYFKKDTIKNISTSSYDESILMSENKYIHPEPLKKSLDSKLVKDSDKLSRDNRLSHKNISSDKDETSQVNIPKKSNTTNNENLKTLNQHFSENIVMGHPEYFSYPIDSFSSHPGKYPADFLPQSEIAQSLGIPPTDPLLMESFVHGYAMELEYARIMHQETQAKLLNARKQRPKKYRCPHCDVGFSNNGQLKGHVRIHTGERPFKCDDKTCGKTFTRNEELTRHRRIHSGLRPYPCQTCGKKFGRRDHLKKHTRTHMVQAERMMPMFVPLVGLPAVGGYPYLYGY